jgi:hypothetical protein
VVGADRARLLRPAQSVVAERVGSTGRSGRKRNAQQGRWSATTRKSGAAPTAPPRTRGRRTSGNGCADRTAPQPAHPAWAKRRTKPTSEIDERTRVKVVTDQPFTYWHKSSRGGGNGRNCLEVATLETTVALRDSKDRTGPVLVFTKAAWKAFLPSAKDGSSTRPPDSRRGELRGRPGT